MTRRDYLTLAGSFAAARQHLANMDPPQSIRALKAAGINLAEAMLIEVLSQENPRFDAELFRRNARLGVPA